MRRVSEIPPAAARSTRQPRARLRVPVSGPSASRRAGRCSAERGCALRCWQAAAVARHQEVRAGPAADAARDAAIGVVLMRLTAGRHSALRGRCAGRWPTRTASTSATVPSELLSTVPSCSVKAVKPMARCSGTSSALSMTAKAFRESRTGPPMSWCTGARASGRRFHSAQSIAATAPTRPPRRGRSLLFAASASAARSGAARFLRGTQQARARPRPR